MMSVGGGGGDCGADVLDNDDVHTCLSVYAGRRHGGHEGPGGRMGLRSIPVERKVSPASLGCCNRRDSLWLPNLLCEVDFLDRHVKPST